eukprot:7254975-Ditylum_brightwellii.AAC.1
MAKRKLQELRHLCLHLQEDRTHHRRNGLRQLQQPRNCLGATKLYTKVMLVKCMHNWLNTWTQKQKFYEGTVANCPIYTIIDETWVHLFKCSHEGTAAIRM